MVSPLTNDLSLDGFPILGSDTSLTHRYKRGGFWAFLNYSKVSSPTLVKKMALISWRGKRHIIMEARNHLEIKRYIEELSYTPTSYTILDKRSTSFCFCSEKWEETSTKKTHNSQPPRILNSPFFQILKEKNTTLCIISLPLSFTIMISSSLHQHRLLSRW